MNNYKCLLSIDEAADHLNISPFTLRAWVHQGRVPYIKLGSRVLFDKDDLRDFIEQHRVNLHSS